MRTLAAKLLLALLLLGGCGQMGPLYMPTERATSTGDPAAGVPAAGGPAAGDPASDPTAGDPAAGDTAVSGTVVDDSDAGDASGATPRSRF